MNNVQQIVMTLTIKFLGSFKYFETCTIFPNSPIMQYDVSIVRLFYPI